MRNVSSSTAYWFWQDFRFRLLFNSANTILGAHIPDMARSSLLSFAGEYKLSYRVFLFTYCNIIILLEAKIHKRKWVICAYYTPFNKYFRCYYSAINDSLTYEIDESVIFIDMASIHLRRISWSTVAEMLSPATARICLANSAKLFRFAVTEPYTKWSTSVWFNYNFIIYDFQNSDITPTWYIIAS